MNDMKIDIQFPNVFVTFPSYLNDINFKKLVDTWEQLYEFQQPFTMIFDCSPLYTPPPKYALKVINFMKKIRKKKPQYLEKSVILIPSPFVLQILKMVLNVQKPVAPLYFYAPKDNSIEFDVYKVFKLFQLQPELFSYVKNAPEE